MEALAAGTEDGKERREKVCRITTKYPEPVTEAPPVMNGHAVKPEHLTAPTELDLPSTIQPQPQPQLAPTQQELSKPEETAAEEEKAVVQEGKLIPASRPEPVTFVTATEGVETLNEKTENLTLNGSANGNGNAPYKTITANLLDPNVKSDEGKAAGTEAAHEKHELHESATPALGTGVEEPPRKSLEENLVQKFKETIRV